MDKIKQAVEIPGEKQESADLEIRTLGELEMEYVGGGDGGPIWP